MLMLIKTTAAVGAGALASIRTRLHTMRAGAERGSPLCLCMRTACCSSSIALEQA